MVWSVIVLGGEFILLLFVGVMAAGCWSELRVAGNSLSIALIMLFHLSVTI